MYKKLIKTIFREAKEVKLDKEKKNSIERDLLLFIKDNPAKTEAKNGFFKNVFLAGNIITAYKFRFRLTTSVALALSLVLFIANVSAKAESSLPGDVLYPVKVDFNEKIKLILSFSDEAKTKKNIQFNERRLQEAEQLIIKGKMNKNNQIQINNNFENQVKRATNSIEKLNNTKMYGEAAKISSDFEASLAAHSHILDNLKENKTEGSFIPLAEKVKDAASKISDSNTGTMNNVFGESGVNISEQNKMTQEKMKSAEDSIAEVKKIMGDAKNKIKSNISSQIEDNLKKAEEKLKEGKSKIEDVNNNYKESFSLFQEADIIAKESKNLIENRKNLGLDVNADEKDKKNGENQNQKETDNNDR